MRDRDEALDAQGWLSTWRARRWVWWRALVLGEATLWGASAAAVVARLSSSPIFALVAGIVVAAGRAAADGRVRDVRRMLQSVEAGHPALGNALVAWHEVDVGALSASSTFRRRLEQQARTALETAKPAGPRRAEEWMLAAGVLAATILAVWLVPAVVPGTDVAAPSVDGTIARPASTPPVTVGFVVTPPRYTGLPAVDLADVELIEALVGSTVVARYRHAPADGDVRLGTRLVPVRRDGDALVGELVVEESGLLTLLDAGGRVLRTTAVQALPDAAPVVRVERPGEDLRVADLSRRIPVAVSAADDIGLRSLRVRYTHVTGSGESFEFVDGELPLRVRQTRGAAWQGEGTFDLEALRMGPGDSLVYYAVAQDGRTDVAGLAESERYLIEIPKPGDLAGGDFSLPEPERRYALSQRMLIQLTERLLERRPRMVPADYMREAQGLAVQQRRVRAEFVFLMGGEVVDEVEEAAHSHEVEAGRLDNSGQQELLEAVRQMAQAEQRLTDANLEDALPFEYRALNAIQAAFGKARYFMRTLPTAVAIDPSRRGSGDLYLADPSTWQRAPLGPSAARDARRLLTRVSALTPESDASLVRDVAADLVALDGQTTAWLQVAQGLSAAFADSAPEDVRRAAIDAAGAALRGRVTASSPATLPLPLARGDDEAALARAAGRPR